MKPFTSKHCTQYLTKESPFNQNYYNHVPKLRKRGRIQGIYFQNTDDGIIVEDNDWQTKKVNDPKGVLNRDRTNKEWDKGYRVKREKDGSVTLKGRRGNIE